jgi:hypothetical protein
MWISTLPSPVLAARSVAPTDGAAPRASHLTVTGGVAYEWASELPAGGDNYNGPTDPFFSRFIAEVSAEFGTVVTPNFSFFAVAKAELETGGDVEFDLQRLYFTWRDALGIRALDVRVGRDALTLGPIGLLLDEMFYEEDRRDGVQIWLPDLGPTRIFLFGQMATDDWSAGRYVWGGRAEIEVRPGWTLGFNLRADTASAAGVCPGVDCNTGAGWGADLEAILVSGATLTLGYASYAQTGDTARPHFQANVALDLEQLVGIRQFEPTLTLWYKSLGPYTMPGGPTGGTPRGAFGTPDDFNLFNVNDNLSGFGARLDLDVRGFEVFALAELGSYRDGGPNYNVVSMGVARAIRRNVEVKLSYNRYAVSGGSVVTSPVSGIELGNVTVYRVEVEAQW